MNVDQGLHSYYVLQVIFILSTLLQVITSQNIPLSCPGMTANKLPSFQHHSIHVPASH